MPILNRFRSSRGRRIIPKSPDHSPKLVDQGKNRQLKLVAQKVDPASSEDIKSSEDATLESMDDKESNTTSDKKGSHKGRASPEWEEFHGISQSGNGTADDSETEIEDVVSIATPTDHESFAGENSRDIASIKDEGDNDNPPWEVDIPTVAVSSEELQSILKKTPSKWDHIQPLIGKRLPISYGPSETGPSSEDLNALSKVYKSYPFHTSQNPNSIRSKIEWKPRQNRCGDMAVIAGTDMPILFAVVGRIARNGSFCASDTNWKSRVPGRDYTMPFPDIKARLVLEVIPDPDLQNLFDKSIHFLRTVTNACNVHEEIDVLCGNPQGRQTLTLTHPFFEAKSKSETKYPESVYEWLSDNIKREAITPELLKTWKMEQWPTHSSETAAELKKIQTTHRAMPLPIFVRSLPLSRKPNTPAWAADWSLLKPDQYGIAIHDSVALATFNLIHFVIDGKDFWHAIPVDIRLLTSKIRTSADAFSSPLYKENANLILDTPSSSLSTPKTPSSNKKRNRPSTPDSTPSKKKRRV